MPVHFIYPDLSKLVQKPLPSYPVAKSLSKMPEGLSESDRTLVEQMAEMFVKFENSEFADPNENTARNRQRTYIKEISRIGTETLENAFNDEKVQSAIKTRVAQKLADAKVEASNGKKVQATEVQTTDIDADNIVSEFSAEVQKELKRRDDKWETDKYAIVRLLDDFELTRGEWEKEFSKEKKDKEKKDKEQKQKEEEKSREAKPAPSPAKPTEKPAKLEEPKPGSIGDKIIKSSSSEKEMAKYMKFLHGIRENEMVKTMEPIKKAQARIAKAKMMMESIGKGGTAGGAKKLFGSAGKVAGFALGGVVGAVSLGAGLVVGAVKFVGKTIGFVVKGVIGLGKKVFQLTKKALNFLLVKPLKWVGRLLKKPGFWAVLLTFLMTPAGMRALGFAVGYLTKIFKKGFWSGMKSLGKLFLSVAKLIGKAFKKAFDVAKPFLKKIKTAIKKQWNKFLDKHPNLKRALDATGAFFKKVGEAMRAVGTLTMGAINHVRDAWNKKMAEYSAAYDEYVAQATADGVAADDLMSKNKFVADLIHKDFVSELDSLFSNFKDLINEIAPIYNFVSGFLSAVMGSKWLLPLIGIFHEVWTYKDSNVCTSAVIATLSLVYGPLGTILGGLIGWAIEKAVMKIYGIVKRKEGKLLDIAGQMERHGGADLLAKRAAESKEFLGKIDNSILKDIAMTNAKGEAINDAESKKKYIAELFESFDSTMQAEFASMDKLVESLNRMRLLSSGGRNLNNANNLYTIFHKTGYLDRGFLSVQYFKVQDFLGIRSKELLDFMASKTEGIHADGMVDLNASDETEVNRIGTNVIRVKMAMLTDIYASIVNLVDKLSNGGADQASIIALLYEYLSPTGKMYKGIQKELSQTIPLDIFSTKTSFNDDGDEMWLLNKIKEKGNFEMVDSVNKAVTDQIKLINDGALVEESRALAQATKKHLGVQARVNAEIIQNVAENLTSDSLADNAVGALQVAGYYTGAGQLAHGVASITAAVMTDTTAERYSRIGGTDTGAIKLGDIGDSFTTGNASAIALLGGDKNKQKMMTRTLDDLMAGRTASHPEMVEKLYKGFFSDLAAVGTSGFRGNKSIENSGIAGDAVRVMMDLKEKQDQNEQITLGTFEQIYTNGQTHLMTDSQKKMAQAAYDLFSVNGGKDFEEMQGWMEKVGLGIGELAKNKELLFTKYKGKQIHEIVEEFVQEQMQGANLTEEQKKYLETYFKEGFKDKTSYYKSAIMNKITLNETMMASLQKLGVSTDTGMEQANFDKNAEVEE